MELMACMLASVSSPDSWADIFDMSCPGMFMPFMSCDEFCCAKQSAPARQSRVNRVFITIPQPSYRNCTHPIVLTLPQPLCFAQRRIRRRHYAGNSGGGADRLERRRRLDGGLGSGPHPHFGEDLAGRFGAGANAVGNSDAVIA